MSSWISTFSNQANSSLSWILQPFCLCQIMMELLNPNGWSIFTGQPTLPCAGCLQSWWIGENMQEELGFTDKADKRAEPGTGWTPAKLNRILHDHVVAGELSTFGCVEWESQLFRGTMRAQYYPFNMTKRHFHGFNPKVSIYTFILDVLPVYTSIYADIICFEHRTLW